MTYIPEYNGYVADVADLDFIRCDGTAYSFKRANAVSLTNTANNITISGGQGVYPLAYIDTDRAFEIQFTSAEFTMDMFEMANTGRGEVKDIGIYESDKYAVGGTNAAPVVELPFEVDPASTKIRNFTYDTTAGAGKFTVAVTPYAAPVGEGDPTPAKTTITFTAGDLVVGDEITVTYKRRIIDAYVSSIKTDSASAKGEVTMHFPVYSSGEDCTASAVKGIVHIRVYRARVTGQPGFSLSYKTAATNAVTFAAIDPKRADKKVFELSYEPRNEDGSMKTEATAEVVYD